MKILTTEGFYATNIGNSFFMNGARYILKKCFPKAEIYSLGDVSANQWTSKQSQKNNFNYLKYIDIDYLVITGPCLSNNIEKLYGDVFEKLLINKKTRLSMIVFIILQNIFKKAIYWFLTIQKCFQPGFLVKK